MAHSSLLIKSCNLVYTFVDINIQDVRINMKFNISYEELNELYINQHKSSTEISRMFHVSIPTVLSKIRSFNIKVRTISEAASRQLANKKIGNWEVTSETKYNKHKCLMWKCLCKCCKEYCYVVAGSLLSGKSTGCSKCKDRKHHITISKIFRVRWNKVIYTAKKRGITLDITMEYAWNIFEKQNRKCALSGIEIFFQHGNFTASLDRIDNTKGYIEGNVQWVHKHVNAMKLTHTQQYFIDLCRKVSNNNQ